LSYSQFCELYRKWAKELHPVMRITHKAGENLFVDFAGLTMPYTDSSTGEEKQAHIFVTTWGASNYTYAEAFPSQSLTSWVSGHVRVFKYFGRAPEVLVPDNTKTAVTSPVIMNRILIPPTWNWPSFTDRLFFPPGSKNPKIRPKLKREYKWLSTGLLLR